VRFEHRNVPRTEVAEMLATRTSVELQADGPQTAAGSAAIVTNGIGDDSPPVKACGQRWARNQMSKIGASPGC
jgi:hypothetical protein